MSFINRIESLKIIPVVVINNVKDALPLGNALIEAGLPVIEITFRTAAAAESISVLKKEKPDMLVGAGTVLKIEQVKNAVAVGAEFIVSPGFNPTIVDYCVKNDILIIPGLNSPTFIEWGLERGLTHFKFYPADMSGGPRMLQLLAGPYPTARFMPTGGINNTTIIEYLKLNNVFACGGSWIVKKELINNKNFKEITKRTKEAVSLVSSEIG